MRYFFPYLLLFYIFLTETKAQILFQDIADYSINLGQVANFDADGDGAADLSISGNFANSMGFFVISIPNGNSDSRHVQSLSNGLNGVQRLNFGQIISANSGNFVSAQTNSCVVCINNTGDWQGGTADTYVGFRLEKNSTGQIHYGWLRVAVSSTINQITIKEIGFQRSPSISIQVGFVPINNLTINGLGGVQTISTDDGQLQIQAQISPQNASLQQLNWTVDNPILANVDANGLLTALADGSVLVRAETNDGSSIWDTTRVIISNQIVNVNQIEVSYNNPIPEINSMNGTLQMTANALPTYANNRNVNWSVDNKAIASIDANGLLTAKQNGTVRVVATSADGGRVSGYETVQINGQFVFISGLSIQGGNNINSPNGTLQLSALISPSNANAPLVAWQVDSPKIAEINAAGELLAHRNGTVRVTAKATDGSGVENTTIINISNQFIPVQNITVTGASGNSISTDNGILQMLATVQPSNADNRNFHWQVDSPHIAEIRPNGQLLAKTNGIVRVYAVAQDNSGIIGSRTVQISNQIIKTQTLQIQPTSGSTAINSPFGSLQLIPIFTPQNTSNQDVVWTVDNPNLADISSTGLLFAKQNGTIVVNAISQDGSGVTGSININISGQPTVMNSLQIQGNSSISTPYGTSQLSILFSPSSATNPSVVYTCDRPNIAVVSPQGLVQALANGTATITATAQDGSGLSASFSILISNQEVLINNLSVQSGRGTFSINQERDTLQLYSIFSPSNASNSNVFWASSNPLIATITNSGLVSAVSNGSVTITAHSQDGSGWVGQAVINVSNQLIPVQNISISGQAGANSIGTALGELQLSANISPSNASNQRIVWSVDSPQIAFLNPNGVLIARQNGNVNVIAQSIDGSNTLGTANFAISNQPIAVNRVKILSSRNFINNNADTLHLFANVSPSNANNSNIIWVCNPQNIATISQNGVLTAQNNGVAQIIALSQDFSGVSDTFLVNISNQNTAAISLSVVSQSGNYQLNTPNEQLQFIANFSPISATAPSIFWSVDNPSIARINPNGLLTALSDGIVTITARAQDENRSFATTTVTVSGQSVLISNLELNGSGGVNGINTLRGSLQLIPTINPSNATNTNLVFKSLSANIAQVTQTGNVLAFSNGIAQIVAYTQDGSGICDTIDITISNQFVPVSNISVQGVGGITFINTAGGNLQLQNTISPLAATVQNVGWSVTDTNLATISAQGLLKAKSNGIVRVLAHALDGSNVSGFIDIDITNQPIWVQTIQVQGQGGQNFINIDNQTLQMEAIVLPANASNPAIRWQLVGGGTGWAAINATSGVLTPRHNGTITIRATSQDGSLVYGETTITISNQTSPTLSITSVSLNAANNFINTDKGRLQITATLSPNAANRNRTWSVSPAHLASIDQRGILQAINNGTVTVTATSFVGGLSDDFIVTISNQYQPVQNINLSTISGSTNITVPNGTDRLQTNIQPTNASNSAIFYSLNPSNLAHISTSGEITAFANGTITATAFSLDGSNQREAIIINISNQRQEISSLSINSPSSAINTAFGELAISFTSSPNLVNVAYSVSDNSIAQINPQGILTPIANGSVWVRVRALDGSNLSDSVQISISNQPVLINAISVSGSNFINQTSGQAQLTASISPSNANNQNIIWAVNDENLATISAQGILTAKNNGIVQIYALSQDGSGITGNFSITVSNQNIAASSLSISSSTAQNQINTAFGALQMLANFSPANASNQNVIWSVDNPLLAFIQPNGKLYAISNGTVIVQAHSRDGANLLASFSVSIQNQLIKVQQIGLSFSNNTIAIDKGTSQISYSTNPIGNNNVYFQSQQPTLGNINQYGLITAIQNGWLLLKGYAQDSSGVTILDSIFINNQHQLATAAQISTIGNIFEINQPFGTLQLTATAIPSSTIPTAFQWTSSNPGIAQIYPNGLLVGRNNGVVTITARALDGSNVFTTQNVTISNQSIVATGLNLTSSTGANTITTTNGSLQMLCAVQPANASIQNVYFFTNNPAIATINQQGLLIARGNGIVAVQVRTIDGTNLTTAFTVTITNQPTLVTNLSISTVSNQYLINTSEGILQFTSHFIPATPSNNRLAWAVTPSNLAHINENGLLTAYQNGVVSVSARSLDGSNFVATRNVTISNQSIYIHSFNPTATSGGHLINTRFGQSQFVANPSPANASSISNIWWSDNPQIASVSDNGFVRAHQNGSAKIYLQALDRGEHLDSLLVTVSNQPVICDSLHIFAQSQLNFINIFAGNRNIIANFAPALISNPNLAWFIDKPNLARIDANGQVTALGFGNDTIIITARTQDRSAKTAICSLILSNQIPVNGYLVEEIEVFSNNANNSISLNNGTLQLFTNIFPQFASNTQLNWSVENPQIATIDAQGLITAHSDGTMMAFAHSSDGGRVSGLLEIQVSNQIIAVQELTTATEENLHVQIFPNPVNDYFNLRVENAALGELQLYIYSLAGQPVFSQQLFVSQNQEQFLVENLPLLPPATYILRLQNDKITKTVLLIKK